MTRRPDGPLTRRSFLRGTTLVLAGAAGAAAGGAPLRDLLALDEEIRPAVRVGLLTDLHHGEKEPAGTRHYRETRTKLREAIEHFKDVKPDVVVELGDLIDAAPSVATEIAWLEAIDGDLRELPCDVHYVLGNHCVATLTKEEFLEKSGARDAYYSFDSGPLHCVVLDACFRKDLVAYGRNNFEWSDANVPPEELRWLEKDLAATDRKTIVFAHQRLDDVGTAHAVRNAAIVRRVLEQSGKVLAVFQGHHHVNDHRDLNGIHYVTLAAMIEGSGAEANAYSVLEVYDDHSLRLEGFRQQKSYWNQERP